MRRQLAKIKDFLISERFVHAVKTMFACALGLSIVHLFHLPVGQWIIITILVVMSAQIHFGAAMQKGAMRFIGSLSGASIAILVLLIFPNNDLVFYSVLLLSSLFFSYISGISQNVGQAGTLGAVTVAILLLSPNPDLHTALLRTFEIMLGIFLALLVSLTVFPIRAHEKLQKNIAGTLRHLQTYYQAIVTRQAKDAHQCEEAIMEDFIKCRKLIDEAVVEPGTKKNMAAITQEILMHEKHLFRAFSLLEHFFNRHPAQIQQLSGWHEIIQENLANLTAVIEKQDASCWQLPDFSTLRLVDKSTHFLAFFTYFVVQELPALAEVVRRSVS